jgi:hypothetical protein
MMEEAAVAQKNCPICTLDLPFEKKLPTAAELSRNIDQRESDTSVRLWPSSREPLDSTAHPLREVTADS